MKVQPARWPPPPLADRPRDTTCPRERRVTLEHGFKKTRCLISLWASQRPEPGHAPANFARLLCAFGGHEPVPRHRSGLNECGVGQIESGGKLDELVRRNANCSTIPPSCTIPRAICADWCHKLLRPDRHYSHSPQPNSPSTQTGVPSARTPASSCPRIFLGAEGQVAEVRRADSGYAHADHLAVTRRFVDLDDLRRALPAPHSTHARSHRRFEGDGRRRLGRRAYWAQGTGKLPPCRS